jgi:serine/threonine protein kinase
MPCPVSIHRHTTHSAPFLLLQVGDVGLSSSSLQADAWCARQDNCIALARTAHSSTHYTHTFRLLSSLSATLRSALSLLLLLLLQVGDVGLSRLMPGAPGRTQLEAAAGGPHVPPQSTMLDSRLVGTPSYMDPEYLRTGRFGPKSDTYSLGE